MVLGNPKAKVSSDDEFAACFMGASVYIEQNLQVTKGDLARYTPEGGKNIEIHITEYGPLVYPLGTLNMVKDAAWNRSLAGALHQACLFNVFTREPKLTSANHLPLHQDVFGALIGVHRTLFSGQKRWRNIVFYVFQMYSRMSGAKCWPSMSSRRRIRHRRSVSCPNWRKYPASMSAPIARQVETNWPSS